MRSVLGIFRAACYSPGMVGRDEAILRAVAERLEVAGCVVRLVHEEDFTADTAMPDVVLHMARSPQVLDILQRWEEAGCRVINSVESVRSVERAALVELCAAQGIPTPKTWIISTAEPEYDDITFPCWVKRTGTCVQEPDDVCRVDEAEEYVQCLSRFHARNIDKVVVMEHLEGPCLKFYAVPSSRFFYCLPASSLGYDKFSRTSYNILDNASTEDRENHTFQLPTFKAATEQEQSLLAGFAERSGFNKVNFQLSVFGGDVIVGADGIARLIDLNDWPSFSACREGAADAIAQLVMNVNE